MKKKFLIAGFIAFVAGFFYFLNENSRLVTLNRCFTVTEVQYDTIAVAETDPIQGTIELGPYKLYYPPNSSKDRHVFKPSENIFVKTAQKKNGEWRSYDWTPGCKK